MTWSEMSTEQILIVLRGSVSVSTDPDTRQQRVWAGYVDGEESGPGDGTAACRELAKRGVLGEHSTEDGYHVWEIVDEWKGKVR